MKKSGPALGNIFILLLILFLGFLTYRWFFQYQRENAILRKVIARLEADSRAAEVLVTGVNYDEQKQKALTTIKFLEYDAKGKPLTPKYFTFSGNIIQFQALVIRFDDIHIRQADRLRGKSAYIFWKVFMLDGQNTQEYEITHFNAIPDGYKIAEENNPFEQRIWEKFWQYALNPKRGEEKGIKNAQIEAPGTMFIPGVLYTIKIEHDGGLRIDSTQLSPILRGEKL